MTVCVVNKLIAFNLIVVLFSLSLVDVEHVEKTTSVKQNAQFGNVVVIIGVQLIPKTSLRVFMSTFIIAEKDSSK